MDLNGCGPNNTNMADVKPKPLTDLAGAETPKQETGDNNSEQIDVKEQLVTITSLLKSFDERLRLIESRENTASDLRSGSTPRSVSQDHPIQDLGGVNDTRSRYSGNAATLVQFNDIQKEFDGIKDSLSKIVLPPSLKVNDSPVGIKTESKPTLKVISKAARYTETGLKLLSTIAKNDDGTFVVNDDEMEALYTILSAESQFLQSEYTQLVVKGSFDEDTARLFRNLESNNAVFTDQSLRNVRIAAELAAVSIKPNNHSRRGRGRGQRFNVGQSPWRGRGSFFNQYQRPTGFPRQPYNASTYGSQQGQD